jgi:imidazolonepropionase-like amidohydrolase
VRRAELARVARAGAAITPTLLADVSYRQTPDAVARAAIADTDAARDARRRLASRTLLAQWTFALDLKRFEGPSDAASRARSLRRQLDDLRHARAAGVPLLVGTDFGVSLVYPGYGVHDELRLLVAEAGLTPLEALRAATIAPARAMGMAESLGTIAPGRTADLVLLDGDPLRDVANTSRIHAVVARGRVLRRADLDTLLDRAADSARASFARAAPR